jgi:hypothetical protein
MTEIEIKSTKDTTMSLAGTVSIFSRIVRKIAPIIAEAAL